MSGILLPNRFTNQPQYPAPIDWGNSITKGLLTLIPFHGINGDIDLVTGRRGTKTGLNTQVEVKNGIYPLFGASNYYDLAEVPAVGTSSPFTIAWTQVPINHSSYSTLLQVNFGTGGVDPTFTIYQSIVDAGYYFAVGKTLGIGIPSFSTQVGIVTNNKLDRYALVCTTNCLDVTLSSFALFRNGIKLTTSSSTTFGNNSSAGARIGALVNGNDAFGGAIGNFHVWKRALSDTEGIAWSQNEFITRKAPSRRIWIGAAGASCTTAIASTTANAVGSIASKSTCKIAITATTSNAVGSIASKATAKTVVSATTANTVGIIVSKSTCKTSVATTTANAVGSIASKATSKTAIAATTANTVSNIASSNAGVCASAIAATTANATGSINSKSTCKTEVAATIANAVGSIASKATAKTAIATTMANAVGAIASSSVAGVATAINATTANAVGAINGYSTSKTTISATLAGVFGAINSVTQVPATSAINATTANAFGSIISRSANSIVISNPFINALPTLYSMLGDLVDHRPAGGGATTTAPALPNSPGDIDLGNRVLVTEHALRYMTTSFPTVKKDDEFTISGVPYIVTEAPISLLDGAERLAVLSKKQ